MSPAGRCARCGGRAVADCCGIAEPIAVETPDGVEIVCGVCFTPVECCIEPGCDGAIVPTSADEKGGAR